ncbi:endonuclease domain-containing protein [Candidatus Peregrinibacteria bacterium]|nr:endonuclease domain-containing protein [Candidatus Peregrinibacteria bacterium]
MLRRYVTTSKETVVFARQLRTSGNPAEKFLWSKLRRKQFFGLRFRRQVPFGTYILDFFCIEKRFVIEIDGDSHYQDDAQENDIKRDAYLAQHSLKILRVGHKEILRNIDGVLEYIQIFLGLEHE